MFSFFRDTYLELSGIDSRQAALERTKKQKEKKENKIIIPSGLKKMIMAFCVLYLISCLGTFQIIWNSKMVILIIRSICQIIVAGAILILMLIKSKKAEIAALIMIGIFFVLQYSGILVFSYAG